MKFQKLFYLNQNQLKKGGFFFEKSAKRVLFMQSACERVNEACEFEKIEIKKSKKEINFRKFYYLSTFSN